MSNLNSITYGRLINTFYQDIKKPLDYTDSHWYRDEGLIRYSSQGEGKDPDLWVYGGFSCESIDYTEKDGYVLVMLDDGCGGDFQAFLSLDKKINPEEFE